MVCLRADVISGELMTMAKGAAAGEHVVVVVVVGTCPEGNPVVQTNREVVTRVSIDRLE